MTLTDPTVSTFTAPEAPAHPLASLTPTEITAVRAIVAGLDGVDEATRFAYVGLEEAAKGEVLAWERGDAPAPERRARVQLLNLRTAHSLDLVVSLATGAVLRTTELDGSDGQLPILDAEFEEVGVIANDDAAWVAALARADSRPTTSSWSRCQRATTASRTRWDAASSAPSPSARTTPPTTRGRTPSTVSPPTSTSPPAR